jgi:membrane-bound inhibitor of C-type lysozyme
MSAVTLRLASLLLATLALTACSSMRIWPFGDDTQQRLGVPPDAVTYNCAGGNSFQMSYLDNRTAVWLIYPDRQVRLEQKEPGRYSNGVAVLDLSGSEAKLTDGRDVAYSGCTIPVAKK